MFGSHLSVAGGMYKAANKAGELGLECLQVFTKNQQQWKAPPLKEENVAAWGEACEANGLVGRTVSHASYLINCASPDAELRAKSINALAEELRRCEVLGIPYLVMHPGAHVGSGEEVGLTRVAKAVDRAIAKSKTQRVVLCLECTAGAGSVLGGPLEHLRDILGQSKSPDRLGICLDTAHLLGFGHDFRGRKYAGFVRHLDATVGVDRVKVWHLNDSKVELGSRKDRHEHIGQGFVGDAGFRPIVRDKRWRDVPKIMETPKDDDDAGRPWDAVNVERLRGLSQSAAA